MNSSKQISGQDKPSSAAITPTSNSSLEPKPHPVPFNNMENSQHSMGLRTPCRLAAHPVNYAQGDVSFFNFLFCMSPSSFYCRNTHNVGSFYLHAKLPSIFVSASIL